MDISTIGYQSCVRRENLFFSLISRLPVVVLAQEKEAHKKYVQCDLEELDLHPKLAKHSSQLFEQKVSTEI